MYTLIVEKAVTKFIKKQDANTRKRLRNAILSIHDNPYDTSNLERMEGYINTYRKRVGKYRIVYKVENDELIVHVVDAGLRGNIYNNWWLSGLFHSFFFCSNKTPHSY